MEFSAILCPSAHPGDSDNEPAPPLKKSKGVPPQAIADPELPRAVADPELPPAVEEARLSALTAYRRTLNKMEEYIVIKSLSQDQQVIKLSHIVDEAMVQLAVCLMQYFLRTESQPVPCHDTALTSPRMHRNLTNLLDKHDDHGRIKANTRSGYLERIDGVPRLSDKPEDLVIFVPLTGYNISVKKTKGIFIVFFS